MIRADDPHLRFTAVKQLTIRVYSSYRFTQLRDVVHLYELFLIFFSDLSLLGQQTS